MYILSGLNIDFSMFRGYYLTAKFESLIKILLLS